MITKNQIKLISSLHHKKFRTSHNLFIAEGQKVIQELIFEGFVIEFICQTDNIFADITTEKKFLVNASDLKKISALTIPNNCLAVFRIPDQKTIIASGLIVALDDIRDPGNLGAILRLCDWFGIEQVVCSEQTVDLYNPKVVQATMGSIARVNVTYTDLKSFLKKSDLTVYGTFMEGENVYNLNLKPEGILVLGNEANGISELVESCISKKITIPRFGPIKKTESLNVATAAAIFLSEFKRLSEN